MLTRIGEKGLNMRHVTKEESIMYDECTKQPHDRKPYRLGDSMLTVLTE